MTGQELARVGSYGQSSLSERQKYALALSEAGDLVPRNFWTKPQNVGGVMQPPRPNPGAILYMLETAAMVGVNPMVGLTNIHIIEGKPSLSANLQAALVREAGHRLRVWVEGSGMAAKAICEIVRSDDPEFTFRVEWGAEESKAAGVDNKDNWKKYRRSMLKARSITECIREACPEVLMGATYSPDELGAQTNEQGEPINLEQVPDASQVGTPGVSRETGKPETPIADVAEGDESFDWIKALTNVESREEASDLYQRGKREGMLNMKIMVGDVESELGAEIIKVGQAFAENEQKGEPLPDEKPAALDEDVVDAEVVEDEPAEAPKPRATRSRKPTPAQEEAQAADEAEAADR